MIWSKKIFSLNSYFQKKRGLGLKESTVHTEKHLPHCKHSVHVGGGRILPKLRSLQRTLTAACQTSHKCMKAGLLIRIMFHKIVIRFEQFQHLFIILSNC